MEKEKIKISNICGKGVLEEKFNIELQKVINNINNLNTVAMKKREIIIKFIFDPAQDRGSSSIKIETSSKLVNEMPVTKHAVLNKNQIGENEAFVFDEPEQTKIEFNVKPEHVKKLRGISND